MSPEARGKMLDHLSREERFDRGLELADRMVEAFLAKQGLAVEPGEAVDEETRRRRFEALRRRED